VIVGDGDRTQLLELARQLNLEPQVSFDSCDDVSVYYAAADLYVSTSQTEAFGLANFEALAAGLPAICTAAGAVPEVVGDAALLIPPGDLRALEVAMRRLIERPELRAMYARRALQRLERWPSAADISRHYLDCYQGRRLNPDIDSDPLGLGSASYYPVWSPMIDGLQHCPMPPPLELPSSGRVLVFAPHPDDEILGCGGTLALLRQQRCAVRVVIMTDGALGDPLGRFDADVTTSRYDESKAALRCLDIDDIVFLGLPDGGVSADETTAGLIRDQFAEFQPQLTLVPPLLDQHRDHLACSLAVLEAWRLAGQPSALAMWELWQPLPVNRVVDISSVFELRQRAAEHYVIPQAYCDYRSASRGLASFRGLYVDSASHVEGFLCIEPTAVEVTIDRLLALRASSE
jgi:LmbE family N-acetylglucosaminyl deacetylase